jgi:exopolyphosphatase/guanosine-5'-triphosphate,3'-diphosphate pyrophosphatase
VASRLSAPKSQSLGNGAGNGSSGPTVSPRATRGAPPGQYERVAAIDIGSNSIRQIVADINPGGAIRVVDEMKAAPRLGAGLSETGLLSAEAMGRAVEAISRMATLGKQIGADRIEVVATSAVRDAANADAFVDLVRRQTSLRVRVLTGEDEARLGFRSALAHFDLGTGRAAVVDIGGGSLELALSAAGLLDRLVTLPFGALRLTERFLTPDTTRKRVKKLRKEVRGELRARLPAREWRGARVIGSGGTFTNLAGMSLARQGMLTARSVHGTTVSRMELEHILDTLQGMSLEERLTVTGLNSGRADIIVAGLAVIAEVMARLDAHELVVSAYGIREGLLLESARIMPPVAAPGDARKRSVRRLAEACHFEERHAVHVQKLALQLFDALGGRLGCDAADRQLLADAALLHDIGYHISYDEHHKHSYYLVLNAELLGMSPAEQVMVANVARYHRGTTPKRAQRNFGSLDRTLRRRIRRLAALLRVADGFDRGHAGSVDRIRVRWMKKSIRLTPIPKKPYQRLRLELWGGSRKARLLAKVAGVPVTIVGPKGEILEVEAAKAQV